MTKFARTCFLWTSEQSAIVFLFTALTGWFLYHRTVGSQPLNVSQGKFGMASSPCHSMWDLGWTKLPNAGFSVFFRFSMSIIPPILPTRLHLHAALTRMTNGRSMGTF